MIDQSRTFVESQVRIVRIRLFFQVLTHSLVLCWGIGLLVAMMWFLVRPFAFAAADDAVRWSVPAASMLLATIAGMTLAWFRRPDRVNSALALDEKFGLKERVTTFLTLTDDQINTPAGQALLGDVQAHLSRLHVASGFPLRLPWRQLLMPSGAFVLAAVAFLLDPVLSDLKFTASTIQAEEPRRQIDIKEIQQQLDKLKKDVIQRGQDQAPKSEELQAMEKEFEKLLNKPIDMKNEEKVKERINEFRNLQDRMKERADELKGQLAKNDALKMQLRKLANDKEAKEGPAKDFEDALMKGDLDKAKKALEKLVKDMKEKKLDAKQQKQLTDQLKDLQERMKKVADEDQFVNKLKKDLKEGKIKKEDFEREMANFQNLQDLTKLVDDTQKAMEGNDGEKLSKEMEKLMKRLEEMEKADREFGDLMRDQQEVEDALNLFNDVLGEGDGMEGGQKAGGRRPIDPNDPNSKIKDERSRAHLDAKGMPRITGYARGGTFSKIPAKAVEGAFRQAVQDAPDAIERQRIPQDAEAITRGYFKNLGNQKE